VLLAAARMKHDVMLVFCIPPVFVAIIMGFAMAIYAWESFGPLQAVACPVLAWFGARGLARRYAEARDFLVAIYLVWAVGLLFASIAISFPDTV
jgi:hypothetical protein